MRIGFDRYLRFAWCERALEEAARGAELPMARARLDEALAGDLEGDRSRTVTVRLLQQIWLSPSPDHHTLWSEALEAYRRGDDTLPLHWGMSMAAYPFFRDIAEAVGRSLRIHDAAPAAAVLRRASELYGERPTVRRSTQCVLRSMIDWGALTEQPKGVYRIGSVVELGDHSTQWILAATLWSSRVSSLNFESLTSHPALFPFRLACVNGLLGGAALVRQGGGQELAVVSPNEGA